MSATTMTTTNVNGTGLTSGPQKSLTMRDFLQRPDVVSKIGGYVAHWMPSDKFIGDILMQAQKNPDIYKCTHLSLLRCAAEAAFLKIRPTGFQGRGYLVPRKRNFKDANGNWQNEYELSFDPGWRGLIDIARRAVPIDKLEAHVVFDADEFSVRRSPFTEIVHVPNESTTDSPIRAAYAAVRLSSGAEQIEIVVRRDLDKIRKLGAEKGPWASWPEEMARKTAVRRLCKYLPYDPESDQGKALDRALQAAAETDNSEITEVVATTGQVPQAKRLAEKISARIAIDEETEETISVMGEAGQPEPEPAQSPTPEQPKVQAKPSAKKSAKPEVDANGVVVERDPNTGEIVPPLREPGEEG